jgi:[ribosomal protein S18]-alanine N-acetyltransferase
VSGITRPAERTELAWVAPPAVRAQVVADVAELARILAAEPWRVRVTERGEAAFLERWRPHLNDCAVLGLWCLPRRVPVLVADLLEVAREQGFDRLLGPLVPEQYARPYLESGLRVVERVRVLRTDAPLVARASAHGAPGGVTFRVADPGDLPAVARLDAACFEPFWHYDLHLLERLATTGRVAVALRDGAVIGYTLATARGGDGSLGRLAVAPSMRRRGVGRALVSEAVAWMASRGARSVVLSTQEDNEASLALYRRLGFRESPGALVACASGPLQGPSSRGAMACRTAG